MNLGISRNYIRSILLDKTRKPHARLMSLVVGFGMIRDENVQCEVRRKDMSCNERKVQSATLLQFGDIVSCSCEVIPTFLATSAGC